MAGADAMPKGSTVNTYTPRCVANAVAYCDSAASGIWWNPDAKSNTER